MPRLFFYFRRMTMNWTIIKCLAAHIYADYGAQTTYMAMRKNNDAVIRAALITLVASRD
jgi:hypothetical protein